MQTQQGKFSRTTAGRETKFYELEEKKTSVTTTWPLGHRAMPLKLWVTSGYMLLNEQCWEKRIKAFSDTWELISSLQGNCSRMHATKGGTSQERDDTGHTTSNLRGKENHWDGVCPRRGHADGAEEGLHSCPDLKVDNMQVSRTIAFIGSGWLSSKTDAPNRNNLQKLHDFLNQYLSKIIAF